MDRASRDDIMSYCMPVLLWALWLVIGLPFQECLSMVYLSETDTWDKTKGPGSMDNKIPRTWS